MVIPGVIIYFYTNEMVACVLIAHTAHRHTPRHRVQARLSSVAVCVAVGCSMHQDPSSVLLLWLMSYSMTMLRGAPACRPPNADAPQSPSGAHPPTGTDHRTSSLLHAPSCSLLHAPCSLAAQPNRRGVTTDSLGLGVCEPTFELLPKRCVQKAIEICDPKKGHPVRAMCGGVDCG